MARLPVSTMLRILPAFVLVFLLYCLYRYSMPETFGLCKCLPLAGGAFGG